MAFWGPRSIPQTKGTVFRKLTAQTRGRAGEETGLKAQCSIVRCGFMRIRLGGSSKCGRLRVRTLCKHMRISAFFVAVGVTLPWICQGQTELNLTPSRAVGQPALQVKSAAPNVPERRSLNAPYAVVVDTSSTPPAIFVSDTFNNRVLGWRNATQFS